MREALPALQRTTLRASQAVARRLGTSDGSPDLVAIDRDVQRWFEEVRCLGAVPRGLWLVEFPARAGWFGWRLGDRDFTLFRLYGAPPEERAFLH